MCASMLACFEYRKNTIAQKEEFHESQSNVKIKYPCLYVYMPAYIRLILKFEIHLWLIVAGNSNG